MIFTVPVSKPWSMKNFRLRSWTSMSGAVPGPEFAAGLGIFLSRQASSTSSAGLEDSPLSRGAELVCSKDRGNFAWLPAGGLSMQSWPHADRS